MKIRAVIVEDETAAKEMLQNMLQLYCPNIEIVDHVVSVKEGVKKIKDAKPDLVFCDISIKGGTSFDILKAIDPIDFKIIFITGMDDQAIQAFKFSALDYLLKPVDPDDLENAVQKVEKKLQEENIHLKIQTLFGNMGSENKKVVLKTQDSLYIVKVSEIIRCEAQGNYTMFYLQSRQQILVSKTLKDYSEMLEEYHFFRLHHSHLINLHQVSSFSKKDGGIVTMQDNSQVPLASRKKDIFLELLGAL